MPNNRTQLRSAFSLMCIGMLALVCIDANADGVPVTSVQTVMPTRGIASQPVRAYGTVAASSSNTTTIGLPYVARIEQLRVQAGQAVARGAPLFVAQADPAAVVAAAQARSAAQLAEDELARTQSLVDLSLATQSQLATARKAALDARQALAAQQELDIGSPSGRKTIVAPHDGVVSQVSVATGDQVQAGAAILQLSSASGGTDAGPNVTLGVEPADAASIHPGDAVVVSGLSTALQTVRVPGHVVMVGASIDAQSQLVNIGANVSFGPGTFIPGTRVKAEIATSSGTHWLIPRSALLSDSHGAYVYQTGSDSKAHRINVKRIVEDGERYGVDGAIDAKRPLVVVGNYELQDGSVVHIENPAQSVAGQNKSQGTAQ